jgi:hypothetical protein
VLHGKFNSEQFCSKSRNLSAELFDAIIKQPSYYCFRSTDFVLTAPVAFTVFSIFTALQFTVSTLPIALRANADASVCFDRMKKFLLLPEYLIHPQDLT